MDDKMALRAVERLLESEHEVLTTTDPAQALQILGEHGNVRVLLCEEHLPKMTGAELLDVVRREHPEVTRIITSNRSNVDPGVDVIRRGHAFHVIPWPWQDEELKLVIGRALESSRMAQEKHELVQKLAASERRYRSLLDSALCALIVEDQNGRIDFVNERCLTLFGYQQQELIGRRIELLVPERPQWKPANVALVSDQQWLLVGRRKDGSEFPIDLSLRRVETDHGTGTANSIVDVSGHVAAADRVKKLNEALEARVLARTSELTAANRRLQASEAEFRSITQTASAAIFRIDHEHRVRFWNPAARGVFGFASEDILGQPVARFLDFDGYHAALAQGLERITETNEIGVVENTELVGLRKGGHEIPVELSLSVMYRSGEWSVIGIARDVSAQRLHEFESYAALDAAERANLAKSRFLANISHEIRTPMNSIFGFSQILANDRTLSAEQRSSVDAILSSSKNLLVLISDVLEMAKIEAGQAELNPTSTDLRQLLEGLTAMFGLHAQQKGLEFRVEIADDIPPCLELDQTRTRQIVVNLVGNAFKFTQHGRVTLRARIDSTPNQDWLQLDVEDTGQGIAPEDVGRIFDHFEQLGSTDSSGTGLGLAISRQYVELMKGELTLQSTVGVGSTFRLRIPVQLSRTASTSADTPSQLLELDALNPEYRTYGTVPASWNRQSIRDHLDKMPRGLVDQLLAATIHGDVEELRGLLKGGLNDQAVVSELLGLVERYEYEALAELFSMVHVEPSRPSGASH